MVFEKGVLTPYKGCLLHNEILKEDSMSKNSRNFYNFLSILGLVLAGNMLVTPSVKATVSCHCAIKSNYRPELHCIKLLIPQLDNEVCRQQCNGVGQVFMVAVGNESRAWHDCENYVRNNVKQ